MCDTDDLGRYDDDIAAADSVVVADTVDNDVGDDSSGRLHIILAEQLCYPFVQLLAGERANCRMHAPASEIQTRSADTLCLRCCCAQHVWFRGVRALLMGTNAQLLWSVHFSQFFSIYICNEVAGSTVGRNVRKVVL